ncbi:MAG TPA: HAMP domain-containing sensor histidine kinase [Chitinophagaceae bacterium]|nr:HAMP domain-containing sensor histidine kinase [Chitinophagaceae bacterium]
MKPKKFSIFRRITIMVFALITILGVLFMALTYYATTHYHLASTQLLNKDVAAHIAKFASPFDRFGINKRKADSVFKNVMILNPSTEVYFLDTAGNVMDFYGPNKEIKLWKVPLENIDKFILSKGEEYIKSPDPRDQSHDKIFSAAEVISKPKKLGYIYVILGSNEYRTVSEMLFSSHISNFAIKAFIFIILLSIALSLLYIQSIQKRFNRMVNVLEKFQNGDFNARFKIKDNDELASVSLAFNKMADLLTYNIDQLTKSEMERKDFIANISHDLLTPLSIARGYAETIVIKKHEISQPEIDNYVDMILKKMLQVEHMVKQLFEITKMESPEFKAKKESFVLSEIVQETVNTFQLIASQKGVTLKCIQCQYHVWVSADIKLMERVIQNLVDNAVKNTSENGIIKVALQVENNNLIFNVENTSNPLSEELINWINNEEARDAETKPSRSGLGLVIVKKILHLHGSVLKAQVTNNNNIFSFSLPISNPASILI